MELHEAFRGFQEASAALQGALSGLRRFREDTGVFLGVSRSLRGDCSQNSIKSLSTPLIHTYLAPSSEAPWDSWISIAFAKRNVVNSFQNSIFTALAVFI